MVFFSWKRIYRKTGGSSNRILLALRALVSKSLPKNRYDPLYDYYYTDFSGKSFLINPESLLVNEFRYTPKEIAQYIGLASFRSYSHYLNTNDASLELLHSPVDEDIINNNRLLRIHEGRIYFLYEESNNRRNKLWH